MNNFKVFGILFVIISMTMIVSIKGDHKNDIIDLCAVICEKCLLEVDLCVDLNKARAICHSHGHCLLNADVSL
ncbi:hypothetical protein ACQ4LE_001007 [Meloidogyne hapla]